MYINLFFIVTAPPQIYTLSLHDALPISRRLDGRLVRLRARPVHSRAGGAGRGGHAGAGRHRHEMGEGRRALSRSEEHTSELQSLTNLVCRLLLEKKK